MKKAFNGELSVWTNLIIFDVVQYLFIPSHKSRSHKAENGRGLSRLIDGFVVVFLRSILLLG